MRWRRLRNPRSSPCSQVQRVLTMTCRQIFAASGMSRIVTRGPHQQRRGASLLRLAPRALPSMANKGTPAPEDTLFRRRGDRARLGLGQPEVVDLAALGLG